MPDTWDKKVKWPELKNLNNGNQFAEANVTYDIFNSIVDALLYLYYKEV